MKEMLEFGYIIYFLSYNIVISVQNYPHISTIISFIKIKK